MSFTLYGISAEQLRINDLLEESAGEITPEIEEALVLNQENFLVKSEGYIQTIRKYSDMNDLIDAEIKRLQAYKKTCSNIENGLKSRMLAAMDVFAIDKAEVGLHRLSTRKSTSVHVEDAAKLPKKYILTHTSPDKTLIKEDLKKGVEVPGASLQTNVSLQIK